MSNIKPIIVDNVDSYNIPLTLRDGTTHTLKLRDGFTMSNEDSDKILAYGAELYKNVGKSLTDAGIEDVLNEEQMDALSDQEKAAYMEKLEKANGDEAPLTESKISRKIISFAYDVTDEWLYKNTNGEVISAIMAHVQEWMGLSNAKKS